MRNIFGSLKRLFFHFRRTGLVSLAASPQALITLRSPNSPELPMQPEQSLSSAHIISFFVKFWRLSRGAEAGP